MAALLPPRTTVLIIDPHKEDREYWVQRLNISSPDYVVLDQVLINLVPRARHPEIAVIFFTRLVLYPMGELAMRNGAQDYLIKAHACGDHLDWAIQKAMFASPLKKRILHSTLSRRRCSQAVPGIREPRSPALSYCRFFDGRCATHYP